MNNIRFVGVPFDYGVELNNGRPRPLQTHGKARKMKIGKIFLSS